MKIKFKVSIAAFAFLFATVGFASTPIENEISPIKEAALMIESINARASFDHGHKPQLVLLWQIEMAKVVSYLAKRPYPAGNPLTYEGHRDLRRLVEAIAVSVFGNRHEPRTRHIIHALRVSTNPVSAELVHNFVVYARHEMGVKTLGAIGEVRAERDFNAHLHGLAVHFHGSALIPTHGNYDSLVIENKHPFVMPEAPRSLWVKIRDIAVGALRKFKASPVTQEQVADQAVADAVVRLPAHPDTDRLGKVSLCGRFLEPGDAGFDFRH